MSVDVTTLRANFAKILADWSETLTIKRSTVVYASAGATETWATSSTPSGAWQPISGAAQRAEAGLQVKSDAQVFFATTVDVQAGDRIYRVDGTWGTVNYPKVYIDHITAFVTTATGEPA
jgi:hypothetical protein